MAETRLDGAIITVEGRQLSAEMHTRLLQVRVEESVQLPDSFDLRFEDAYFKLFDAGAIAVGNKIEIAVRADGDPLVITSGEVTAIGVEQGLTGRHELVISGMDLAHRMAHTNKRRSFQSMSDADIAGQIAAEYSLTADVDSTSIQHDYVLQANETDMAFLRRRATRNGHDVWITGTTLHVKQRPEAEEQPPTVRWGENLLKFTVRFTSTERCDEVVVTGGDPLAKETVVGRSSKDQPFTSAPAAAESNGAARSAFGTVARNATTLVVRDQSEADALAESLIVRATGETAMLRGEAKGDPAIGAGADIRIEGVGSRLSGSYRATSVVHLMASGKPYLTRFVCGGKEPAGLADLVGGPRGSSPLGPVLPSLMVGEVTNTDDPEKLCRVKVKLPTLSSSDESAWARLAAPGAGPDRGIQWVPEVNDEVLVGFELGDPSRPIVVGGLWSRANTPPDPSSTDSGQTKKWSLVSRKGSTISIIDDPDPKIELSTPGGEGTITIDGGKITVSGSDQLVVKASAIDMKAEGAIKIKGSSLDLSASGTVTVSGSMIKLN